MDNELASVRGIVNLSAEDALSRAQQFLTQQGYTGMRRAGNSLTMQRHSPDDAAGRAALVLTIMAIPQPGGGVRIKVRGNDSEGLHERQGAFIEWADSLPKKPEAATTESPEQHTIETSDVQLPPPPKVESQDFSTPPTPPSHPIPPPPRRESTVWRGTKLAFGGCVVLPVFMVLGFIGCIVVLGSGGGGAGSDSEESKSGSSKAKQSAVAIGEPVTVGDVTWTVTNAKQAKQLTQQGVSKQFAKSEQGNFVIVDFDFTNNGSDAITLDNESLALIDSEDRESKPSSDTFMYVSENRRIFLERINPGVTRQGEAIFEVAPGSSGFQLQMGDANMWSDDNGYVDLGF